MRHASLSSLFRSLTGEDRTDLRHDGFAGNAWFLVTIRHVSRGVVSAFVMINLVVRAIIPNAGKVRAVESKRKRSRHADDERLLELLEELSAAVKDRLTRAENPRARRTGRRVSILTQLPTSVARCESLESAVARTHRYRFSAAGFVRFLVHRP